MQLQCSAPHLAAVHCLCFCLLQQVFLLISCVRCMLSFCVGYSLSAHTMNQSTHSSRSARPSGLHCTAHCRLFPSHTVLFLFSALLSSISDFHCFVMSAVHELFSCLPVAFACFAFVVLFLNLFIFPLSAWLQLRSLHCSRADFN